MPRNKPSVEQQDFEVLIKSSFNFSPEVLKKCLRMGIQDYLQDNNLQEGVDILILKS